MLLSSKSGAEQSFVPMQQVISLNWSDESFSAEIASAILPPDSEMSLVFTNLFSSISRKRESPITSLSQAFDDDWL